jgi:lipoprotein-releasing system permease protein
MNWPYEWQIGWRYTRAGRGGGATASSPSSRGVSMLGIALGVAALIIVLSVMNGFQKEVRDRMLSVVAHVEVFDAQGGPWPTGSATARGAEEPARGRRAPFVAAQALLVSRGDEMRGAIVRGVDPARRRRSPRWPRRCAERLLASCSPGLAHRAGWRAGAQLGVRTGDSVTLVAPGGQVTPAGVVPRLKQLHRGRHLRRRPLRIRQRPGADAMDDAARLFRTGRPHRRAAAPGRRAPGPRRGQRAGRTLGPGLLVRDWTRTNRNWFDAVQIEKRMMFIILTLIVAVAAFNLVSTLVMTVTDKRADIAILRTLGASPRSVMGIFVVQGRPAGVIGTLVGRGCSACWWR